MQTVTGQEKITKEIRTAVRHSVVYGLGSVLGKVVGFFMLPFYTHYLNPADYGLLEILDLSMSLFGMFLNMGMTAAMMRSYTTAKSDEQKRKVVSTAFLFVAVTGIITFSAGLGLVRPASALLFGPHVPAKYLLISFSSFILAYIANLPRTYIRALEASTTLVAVETCSLFVMLSLNIYFIAILKIGLMGILLSSLIVLSLQVVLLTGWTIRQVGMGFSRSQLWSMVQFGFPLIFSNMALFALNFSDRFFLQHLRSLEMVGIYAVGYKFAFMMNYLLAQPFHAMWQARMYLVHAQPDHVKIFGQIFVLFSLVLTCAGLALAVLSPEIVHLMVGAQFSSSAEVIPIVTLAYIFYGIGYYVQIGMFLTGRTNLIGIVGAAAACLNLALNYFLILHYGMLGAAWATLLSFAAIAAGSYWLSQRVFPLPLGIGRVSVAIGLAISLYLISRWWTPDSLGIALLMKGSLLAAFPLILWKIRVLSPAEIGTLVSAKDTAVGGVSRLVAAFSGKSAGR